VIAGNGGSELESGGSPAGGDYFGFTLVNLYGDNTVGVISYTRPVPIPYHAPGLQPAAKPAAEKRTRDTEHSRFNTSPRQLLKVLSRLLPNKTAMQFVVGARRAEASPTRDLGF